MHYQKGLSLVELMIAITLGLMLMAGVVQLFISSKDTFRTQQATSRVQETGRMAVEFISRDIRMAGFTGFRGRVSSISNKLSPITYLNAYASGLSVLSAAQAPGINSVAGTDVLVIRGALDGQSSSLILPAETGKFTVALRSTEAGACDDGSTKYNGLCKDKNLIIADYQKTIVFKPSAMTVNGSSLEISYLGSWGGDYLNYEEYFTNGAQISQAKSLIYYVGTGTSGRPSLFQKEDDQDPVELLEGVSNFAVKYNRYDTVNNYVDAEDALDSIWNNVDNPIVSVQLELLVESVENNAVDEKQKYTFNGQDLTADDYRLHQTFFTTIAMRNQLP